MDNAVEEPPSEGKTDAQEKVGDVELLSNFNQHNELQETMDKGDRKDPEGAAIDSKEIAEEYEDVFSKKIQRGCQLGWNYFLLSLCVVGSWALGQTGFSIAWILLLLGVLFVVWQGSFLRLIDESIAYERLRVHRRRALHNDETAEWLNFLINRWWVFSSSTILTLIKNALDPLLNESKPAFVESIELQDFSLGDNTPFINYIKAYDITSGLRKPITPLALAKPPPGLAANLKYQLAIEADVGIHCSDFRMVLRSRLGGKGVGMDLDLALEKLNIGGKLNITLSMNMDASFPHITRASFSFIEKPEVWFNLRIMKTVQMMEVPVLKTWVHSLVMDALTTALVDPGKLDINISSVDGFVPSHNSSNSLAQGVLTVTLSRAQQAIHDEERWCVIRLGEQKQVTSRVSGSASVRWQECRSFLVENLLNDKICIKVKSKRLISTMTLAQFDLPLSSYNLETKRVIETVLQKKGPKGSLGTPTIALRMEYTPLTPVQLDNIPSTVEQVAQDNGLAGVMYICIHNAEGLVAPDKRGFPNPYCIIFCNRKKVKTSHYVCRTSNPKWETCVEFLVADYTQTVVSFAVCSWDTSKMVDSDLLGLGSLAMSPEEITIAKRQIPLTFNLPTNSPDVKNYGIITVSAVFRPVSSVAETDYSQLNAVPGIKADDDENGKCKKNNATFMQHAKMFLGNSKDQDGINLDFADLLSSGLGLMELTVVRAQNLVAKDLNGFSDPYCEVKINGECKFKTSIKKKTLNPVWEESVTIQLPKENDVLAVSVWDRDPLGMRDFLGSITLTLEDIRQYSMKDSAEWFTLKDTKTGSIELKFKVISEDLEKHPVDILESDGMEQVACTPCSSPTSIETSNSFPDSTSSMHSSTPTTVRTGGYHQSPTSHSSSSEAPPLPQKTSKLSNYSNENSLTIPSPLYDTPRSEPNSNTSSKIPKPIGIPVPSPKVPPMTNESNASKTSPNSTDSHSISQINNRTSPEYSSVRAMKQKVKKGLSQPLRRFRSEASVHEDKAKTLRDRVMVERRDPDNPVGDFDSLITATSQPNISKLSPSPTLEKKELSSAEKKTHYFNIQCKIIQALGLKTHQQGLIYCRVKLYRNLAKTSHSSGGKTVGKSSLMPISLNPHFDTEFQLDHASGIPRTSAFVFDIRTEKKESLASKAITLEDLFGESSLETQEICDWLMLTNGVKMEIEISHGKPIDKKQSSSAMKLFRSWSVHRIGKI